MESGFFSWRRASYLRLGRVARSGSPWELGVSPAVLGLQFALLKSGKLVCNLLIDQVVTAPEAGSGQAPETRKTVGIICRKNATKF
jgi:hypothetical protein